MLASRDLPAKSKRVSGRPAMIRGVALGLFLLGVAWAQRDALRPQYAAELTIVVKDGETGAVVPARVYLFKGDRPFRLSPADVMLPLRPDLFYRERLWRRSDDPKTLEVTARDFSHYILLEGEAAFDLPAAGDYRLEVYRGFFSKPAVVEFALKADERRRLVVDLEPVAAERRGDWLAADDHIHLMRAPEDDAIFLQWLMAEDLAVANFLELQRQQNAAVQYGFGPEAEAKTPLRSIRSGHESRSRFYGHTLFLGPREMIRPLSIGLEYANTPEAYPYPNVLFGRGREAGALTGFAHFYGSQPNSTLLLNLAREAIDFVEVFQFGELKSEEWYELLNAGFRVVGLAGSDFPANIGRFDPWPLAVPLLGPERALVQAEAGESAYEAWAEGVRRGAVVLTNGPLLELEADGGGPGAVVEWDGDERRVSGRARVAFHRPIESLEIVRNGEVIARQAGDGERTSLTLKFDVALDGSAWIAARAAAQTLEGEPTMQAHTNPAYFLREGAPVRVPAAREALRERWRSEVAYYQSAGELVFPSQREAAAFRELVDATTRALAE